MSASSSSKKTWRPWWRGLIAKLRGDAYCGRCQSCGDAGCRCGLYCRGGLGCMYPGVKTETDRAIAEGWAAVVPEGWEDGLVRP